MKKCRDIEPLLIGYVSGDILDSQRAVLDEHLKECIDCSEEIVKLQRLDVDLIDLKEESCDIPAGLKASILSEISFKKSASWHKLFSPTAFLSAVTVALAILVVVLAGKVEKISIYSNTAEVKPVKIMFLADNARDVSLVGDFNGWGIEPLILKNIKNGTWEAELKLAPGTYQYNLIVDGKKWVANPNASAHVPDGFGGTNSVVIVNGNGDNQIESVGEKI